MILRDVRTSSLNDLLGKNLRVLGLGLILSCGGASDEGTSGCKNDSECKGNRYCIDGECVEGSRNVPEKDTYSNLPDTYDLDTSQNCTSHFKKVCSDGDVYWKDSCGNLENKIDNCAYGCSNGKCNEPGKDTVSGEDTEGPSCSDECADYGQTKCSGNGWKECGDYDDDSCLEWSDLNSCGSNEKCEGGGCIQTSGTGSYCNPCETDADCVEGMVCGFWEDDGGTVLSTFCRPDGFCIKDSDCGGNDYVCQSKQPNICVPPIYSECKDDYNVSIKDGCGSWLLDYQCSFNEICQDGECVFTGCLGGYYACNNQECIPPSHICDGIPDCSEGEDEEGC